MLHFEWKGVHLQILKMNFVWKTKLVEVKNTPFCRSVNQRGKEGGCCFRWTIIYLAKERLSSKHVCSWGQQAAARESGARTGGRGESARLAHGPRGAWDPSVGGKIPFGLYFSKLALVLFPQFEGVARSAHQVQFSGRHESAMKSWSPSH